MAGDHNFFPLVCLVQLCFVGKFEFFFSRSNDHTSLLRHVNAIRLVRPHLGMKSTRSKYECIGDSKGDLRQFDMTFAVLRNTAERP